MFNTKLYVQTDTNYVGILDTKYSIRSKNINTKTIVCNFCTNYMNFSK